MILLLAHEGETQVDNTVAWVIVTIVSVLTVGMLLWLTWGSYREPPPTTKWWYSTRRGLHDSNMHDQCGFDDDCEAMDLDARRAAVASQHGSTWRE